MEYINADKAMFNSRTLLDTQFLHEIAFLLKSNTWF
jgi:hypothetical protein